MQVSELDVVQLKDGRICTIVDGDSTHSQMIAEFDPKVESKWITWIKTTDIERIIYKHQVNKVQA